MNKTSNSSKRWRSTLTQLMIPLVALLILILFNLFRDPGFFGVEIKYNNDGNAVLSGNLISIIDSASELAIIAMGMTLVTAACGGQDISVGAVGAISGAVFVRVLEIAGLNPTIAMILGILAAIVATMIVMSFNGTLVAVFRIQPMIATLILYSCARSIGYMISGRPSPEPPAVFNPILSAISKTVPGIPIPIPIFIVVFMGLIMYLLFRFTNLRLYTQSVGINQGAARLNGINPTFIKILSFVILGACVAVASIISVARLKQVTHKSLLADIEMDAILAVAIGGNNLGGGRFRLAGSILGAYIIQMLTTTLYAMNVAPVNIKAYKAIVIILIVVAGSPVVKQWLTGLWKTVTKANRIAGVSAVGKGAK